jgi:Spy/CpxP family protein refolding chaperone
MEFNRDNRKAIALLVLVFVLGIALGAVGYMLADRTVLASRTHTGNGAGNGPGNGQPRLVGRLNQELNLTADQQTQIKTVLSDMQHRYDTIREQMGPQFDQARSQGRDQIRQILTPEQRPKFEDFMRRVDEEREKRGTQYRPGGNRN